MSASNCRHLGRYAAGSGSCKTCCNSGVPGTPGTPGPIGPRGLTGPSGYNGFTGPTGFTGQHGDRYLTYTSGVVSPAVVLDGSYSVFVGPELAYSPGSSVVFSSPDASYCFLQRNYG